MAQPTTRQELIDYCKRKLGAPVLEINVADEQIDDLVDDAIQLFQERHFDGVYPTFYKYKITQNDIDRGRSPGNNSVVGLVTTTVTTNIVGTATTILSILNTSFADNGRKFFLRANYENSAYFKTGIAKSTDDLVLLTENFKS